MIIPDEAIILAGGFGTRLRGVVDDMPKALAPVAGRPFLAWLLDALASQGLHHVVLATGYLGDQLEAALGTIWHGMKLVYSREPTPLGTGGAIALALNKIKGDTFFVLNGDTWLELNYAAFGRSMVDAGARFGMALAEVPNVGRYGAVRVEQDRVIGFEEKGTSGAGLINGGVYYIRRGLLASRSSGTAFSFERDVLLPAVLSEPVIGYTGTQVFIDIGVPEDYQRAQQLFGTRPVRI